MVLMYGWMVWVEHAPERYDWAVKVMTFGRIDQIKDEIAERVEPGDRVLDIGCGTGSLAMRCIKRGATVTGLDAALYMTRQSDKRAAEEGVSDKLSTIQDSVTQLPKHFEDEQFDMVTATMVLGEFPAEYLSYVIRECRRILKPGGRLVIADECWPRNRLIRFLYRMTMVVFWIPQFLLLRRPLFPIKDLDAIVSGGDFRIEDSHSYPGTSFRMVVGVKDAADERAASADDKRRVSAP